ncbi:MAG: hypothetical protein MUE98_02440, partial [Rhodobacteraceae bacterium]|nr:hypothetical protein [Paracoccaceae bacterium]
MEQPGLRSDDPDLAFCHLDALGEGAQVVAAEAAAGQAHAVARSLGEAVQHVWCDGSLAGLVQQGLRAGLLGAGLIA